MSSYCCQPNKLEKTDSDCATEKMMTGENESLQEKVKEHNFCSYCKGPIFNGYHLNHGVCHAEQQSIEVNEWHLRNEFESKMRDAIDRGAQMEELSEIFDQEVKRRRGDKYWLDNITKRVAALESEKDMTRRDLNDALIAIQDHEEKARAKIIAECIAMLDEKMKNCHERFDTLQDHLNTVESRLFLCEKVYVFKKDMVFPPPPPPPPLPEFSEVYPNVKEPTTYQPISKGIPFQCPNCDGEGLRENNHPANQKHYPERYLPCMTCEGKGIVWG